MKRIKFILSISILVGFIGFSEYCFGKKTLSSVSTISTSKEGQVLPVNPIDEQTKQVEIATIDAQTAKDNANDLIAKAKANLSAGLILPVEAAKIMGEQNYKIEQANKELAQVVDKAIEKVEVIEEQSGYAQQMMTGVRGLGEKALAPFRSGYGYTEEEKAIARLIIDELTKQLQLLNIDYIEKIKNARNEDEKATLQDRFDFLKEGLEEELYKQQLITGESLSLERKLFWSAVGLAGAVALGTAAKYYLGSGAKASLFEKVIKAPQVREFGEETGGVMVTPGHLEEASAAAGRGFERALEVPQVREEQPETYGEAVPGTSPAEKWLERAATASQAPSEDVPVIY